MSGKKLLLLALGAASLLIGGGFWLWNEGTKDGLEAARQRLRDAHLPMTVADIQLPLADSDNAALVLEKIVPMFEMLPPLDGKNFRKWYYELEEKRPNTAEFAQQADLPRVQGVLALIREAVGKRGYDARIDWSQGLDYVFEDRWIVVASANFLSWNARLSASLGKIEEAGHSVMDMITLAEFLASQPTKHHQRARMAIWAIATNLMEQLAAEDRLSLAWNQSFSDRLAGLNLKSLLSVVDLDRIVNVQQKFDRLLAGGIRASGFFVSSPDDPFAPIYDWKDRLRIQSYSLPGVIRQEYALSLDRMREIRLALALIAQNPALAVRILNGIAPIPSYHLLAQDISSHAADYESMLGAMPQKYSNYEVGDILPQYANLQVARAGLALERYRAAKGRYPAALADLAPDFIKEVPADVFTSKPLLYRPEPGGALIYSVGPNLTDDGGLKDWANKDDISWAAGTTAVRKFTPPSPKPETDEP